MTRYPNIRRKVRAKIVEILKKKGNMDKLLEQYEVYKKDPFKCISQHKIELDLPEVNFFRNQELNELKDYLPSSAFKYIDVIKRDAKKHAGISAQEGREKGFQFDLQEIQGRPFLRRQ